MKATVISYILKVWLTAVFIGALVFYSYELLTGPNQFKLNLNTCEIIVVMIIVGGIYSSHAQ